MVKKFLLMAILPSIMLCFLFSSTATASRIQATLGWHNLENDFYLIVEEDDGDTEPDNYEAYFGENDKIKGGKLRKSVLGDRGTIDEKDLGLTGEFEMWSVDTKWKFDKWINKKGLQALRKAAKKQRRAENDGKKNGWRREYYKDWKEMWKSDDRLGIWKLYNGFYADDEDFEEGDTEVEKNEFIIAAIDKLEEKKIKGRIGDVKFKAYLDIFANDARLLEVGTSEITTVPEPATMVLFGLGLLGIAKVSRRKK